MKTSRLGWWQADLLILVITTVGLFCPLAATDVVISWPIDVPETMREFSAAAMSQDQLLGYDVVQKVNGYAAVGGNWLRGPWVAGSQNYLENVRKHHYYVGSTTDPNEGSVVSATKYWVLVRTYISANIPDDRSIVSAHLQQHVSLSLPDEAVSFEVHDVGDVAFAGAGGILNGGYYFWYYTADAFYPDSDRVSSALMGGALLNSYVFRADDAGMSSSINLDITDAVRAHRGGLLQLSYVPISGSCDMGDTPPKIVIGARLSPVFQLDSLRRTSRNTVEAVVAVGPEPYFFRNDADQERRVKSWVLNGYTNTYSPTFAQGTEPVDFVNAVSAPASWTASGPGRMTVDRVVDQGGGRYAVTMRFATYGSYEVTCVVSSALGVSPRYSGAFSIPVALPPPTDIQVELTPLEQIAKPGTSVRLTARVTALFDGVRMPYDGASVNFATVPEYSVHKTLQGYAVTLGGKTDLGDVGDAVVSVRGDGVWGDDHVRATCEGAASNEVTIQWEDQPVVNTDDLPENVGYGLCPLPDAQITRLTSRVENPQMSHIHNATDYQSMTGSGGCGSCGASAGAGGNLATDLRLDRIHRYADQFRCGSFGPGVFSNFDIQLTLWNHGASGELWDPTAACPIPLTATTVGTYVDAKRSAIAGLALYAGDGVSVTGVDDAVTAVAVLHDGSRWFFELVQTGIGGDADRQGRLTAIQDRVGNHVRITYAFPANATDETLGVRLRLLEMATATDQRGRQLSFAYGWCCGQPVVTALTYPTGAQVIYHYDGTLAGVSAIDYPDGTHSRFNTHQNAMSQCQVVDYLDAGAEGTHRTKSVYLTLTEWMNNDGMSVAQSPNRVRRVVGPTGELTYFNWLERNGAQVQIYVYEGGGSAGHGRMVRLDTTEGVTDSTWIANVWSFETAPSTWSWEKCADYDADALFHMGQQVDPLGKSTVYDRDPGSGAITGRTHTDAAGNVVSHETTQYDAFRQPTWHVDANNIGTRSIYDAAGNLLSRIEGILVDPVDGSLDESHAVTSSWTYRADGQVTSETDALGNTTHYEYDGRGFRTAEVSPPDDPAFPLIRARKTWHFDAAGRLDVSTDAAGHSTTYVYDSRNRVVAMKYGNGSQETLVYGTGADANLLMSKTDRDGVVTTFSYDTAGREISRTEGAQAPAVAITTVTTYLEGTDLPATVIRAGQRTDYRYDTRKRVVETRRWVDGTRYLAETTVFDAVDRVAYTQDAFNRRTYNIYDDLDRVVRSIRESVVGGVRTGANLATLARITTMNPAYVIEETSYDAGGRVLTTTNARGIVTRMGYDALGRMTDRWEAVGTADEGHWQTQYDVVGNRVVEIDPLGHETHFSYNGRNQLASQTVAFGSSDAATTAFTYTLTGQRATQIDPNGHIIQWTYGHCCDWLKDVTDPAGFVTSYAYTLGGKVETVTDANGHVTTTHYDAVGRPFEQIDGRGKITLTTIDDNLTDGVGLDATYANELATLYNCTGLHAVATSNPQGETVVQISDALGRPVLHIDQDRHMRRTFNDEQSWSNGSVLVGSATEDPLSNRTGHFADGLGRIRTIEMPDVVHMPPAGVTTDTDLLDGIGIDEAYYLYDLGDLSSAVATMTIDASGYTTIVVDGVIASSWITTLGPFDVGGGDGNWYVTTDEDLTDGLDVDADYLVELEDAGFYDRMDMWAEKEVDGDGWATLTLYQRTLTSEFLGPYAPPTQSGQITMGYDAHGNRVVVADALGHTQASAFDARNRQVTTTDAAWNTTSVAYDVVGNVLTHTDGRGKSTTFTYTARNQKKSETDRLGNTTAFTYDPAGNLLTISDAENEAKKATVMPEVYEAGKTRYTYTERNQLETERFPGETAARSYTYHPNGQLKTRTDQRGIVTTYGYDGANRLTTRAYSDAPADGFVLDDAGRITTATSGRYGTTVERTWKPTGLIETETTTWPADIGGVSSSTLVQYDYDAANRATTVTYPGGATLVREFTSRNQLDRLTQDGTQIAQAGYDAASRRTSLLYGSGLTDTRTYTDDNRLESTVVGLAAPAQPVLSLGYVYDANRRKTDETDAISATRSQHFGYDDADRLKTWSAGTKVQSWDLTAVGDWKSTTVNGVVENREHSPVHEIAKINNVLVLHDAAGNLARTAQGQGFSWDAENRLLMADIAPNSEKTQGQAFYWYDALGRRVAKRVHDSVTRYVHDGWQVIQELDAPVVATPAEAASDGALANLATVPDGALLFPTYDAEGNRHNPVRVNFQPETAPIPDGFISDKGRAYDVRTNGLSYGWQGAAERPAHTVRHFHPLPQYDTFGLVANGSDTWTWQIALPNGIYPVAIVAGDATSLAHTNNLVVNGQPLEVDPDPGDDTTVPTYEQGDFDGWLMLVQVTDGLLTITAGAGAFNPSLTHVEIGAKDQAITPEMEARLADQILAATQRTGGAPFWNGGRSETRSYVWDPAYIDHLIAYQRTSSSGTETYYAHSGAQYSVQAVTSETGQVVERYSYDAYGTRTVEGASNGGRSAIGLTTGFTGRALDEESGLYYFRNRMYSGRDGRFVSRDPMGYVDGYSMYSGYFAPSGNDPTGTEVDGDEMTMWEIGDRTKGPLIGMMAHQVIQRAYREEHPLAGKIGGYTDRSLGTLAVDVLGVSELAVHDEARRPDIANVFGVQYGMVDLFEIKPMGTNWKVRAISQVNDYVRTLGLSISDHNMLNPNACLIAKPRRGTPRWPVAPRNAVVGDYQFRYWSDTEGVIQYDVFRRKRNPDEVLDGINGDWVRVVNDVNATRGYAKPSDFYVLYALGAAPLIAAAPEVIMARALAPILKTTAERLVADESIQYLSRQAAVLVFGYMSYEATK